MQGILDWLKLIGGGQKVLWALVIFLAASAFFCVKMLTPEYWVDIVKWLTAFVFGGNVVTKGIHAFARNKEENGQ